MAMSGSVPGYMGGAIDMGDMAGGFSPISPLMMANHQLWSSLPGIAQGIWGHSERPFQRGREAYQPFYEQGKSYQNPFFRAGENALPQYQDFLTKMKDPSAFINNMMGQYQESPWAKFQQQQAVRAAQNMGSASGLTSSTPLTQFAQENARNISSQDMNQWLQNVLGINTAYGAGLNDLVGKGQASGNALMDFANTAGTNFGNMAYGEEAGRQQDRNALWGGIAKLFGG